MFVPILLFLAGLALVIKGGDWFVDGATGLAHRFHLPEVLIGATVVSIGTTLPEVMVSSQAALARNSGISYGNAIGSVICNTSLIAAITIAIRPAPVDSRPLRLPAMTFFLAAAVYALTAYTAGGFSREVGFLLIGMFIVYMAVTVLHMTKNAEDTAPEADAFSPQSLRTILLLLVGGGAAIAVGARLLVDNGTLIAEALGVPDSVIGLTMIALGTSLPELVTAVTSLVKGHSALSLGNIIGANIFNIVLVSGMAITICPFTLPAEKQIAGLNASLAVDIPVMFAVMLILCIPALLKKRLYRRQGFLLLGIYAAFTAFQYLF